MLSRAADTIRESVRWAMGAGAEEEVEGKLLLMVVTHQLHRIMQTVMTRMMYTISSG